MTTMKKRIVRFVLPLLMAVIMLCSSCISVAALSISAPNDTDPAWTLTYRDGVISLMLDPDVIHGIIEDKQITKEELTQLIPEDLLELAKNRDDLSKDSVIETLSAYLSAEDLKAMIADLPLEVIDTVLDESLLNAIFSVVTLEELDTLADFAGFLEGTDPAHIEALLADSREQVLSDGVREALLDAGYDEAAQNALGVSEIVAAVGGYDALLSLYTPSDAVSLLRDLGISRLKDFAKASDIEKRIDFKAVLRGVIDIVKTRGDELKTVAKELGAAFIRVINTDVDSIRLNDKYVYGNPDPAANSRYKFDLNALAVAILQGIPDFDDFLALDADNNILASYVVTLDLTATDRHAAKTYTYGFEIGFLSAPTALQEMLAPYADYFTLDVGDDLDVTLDVTVPAVATAVYEKLLTSDKTASIRGKLLSVPTTSINDIADILEGITDEEFSKVVETVSEKVDEIREKAYAKIDAQEGLPAELVAKAKESADKLIEKLLTVETAKKLRDKAVAVLDRIPEAIANKTIDDFYNADTREFAFERQSFSIDLFELISKVVTLPEDAKIYFKDGMTVTGSLDLSARVNDLYRLTLVNSDGAESVYYLPSGISLSTLGMGGIMDAKLAPVTAMPEQDVKLYSDGLYSITFTYVDANGNTVTVGEPLIYAKGTLGASDVILPAIPADPFGDGSAAEWDTDALGTGVNNVKRLEVSLLKIELEDDEYSVTLNNMNGQQIGSAIIFKDSVPEDIWDLITAEALKDTYGITAFHLVDSEGNTIRIGDALTLDAEARAQTYTVVFEYALEFYDKTSPLDVLHTVTYDPYTGATYESLGIAQTLTAKRNAVRFVLSLTEEKINAALSAPTAQKTNISVTYYYEVTATLKGTTKSATVEFYSGQYTAQTLLEALEEKLGTASAKHLEFEGTAPVLTSPTVARQSVTVVEVDDTYSITFTSPYLPNGYTYTFTLGQLPGISIDLLEAFVEREIVKSNPTFEDHIVRLNFTNSPILSGNIPREQTVAVTFELEYWINVVDHKGTPVGTAKFLPADGLTLDTVYGLNDLIVGAQTALGLHKDVKLNYAYVNASEIELEDPSEDKLVQELEVRYDYVYTLKFVNEYADSKDAPIATLTFTISGDKTSLDDAALAALRASIDPAIRASSDFAARPANVTYNLDALKTGFTYTKSSDGIQTLTVIYNYFLNFTDKASGKTYTVVYNPGPFCTPDGISMTVGNEKVWGIYEILKALGNVDASGYRLTGGATLPAILSDVTKLNINYDFEYAYSLTFVDQKGETIDGVEYTYYAGENTTFASIRAELEALLLDGVTNNDIGVRFYYKTSTFALRAADGWTLMDDSMKLNGAYEIMVAYTGVINFVDSDNEANVLYKYTYESGDLFSDIIASDALRKALAKQYHEYTLTPATLDLTAAGTHTVKVKYTRTQGTVTFVNINDANDKTTVTYDKSITNIAQLEATAAFKAWAVRTGMTYTIVDASKIDFSVFADYDDIKVVFTPDQPPVNEYTFTFNDDKDGFIHSFTYKDEAEFNQKKNAPEITELDRYATRGYTVAWSGEIKYKAENQTVKLEYTPVRFNVIFVDPKGEVDRILIHYGATVTSGPPIRDLTAEGYNVTGWDLDSIKYPHIDTTLPIGDITVNAIYTAIEYKATFFDQDGKEMGFVTFTMDSEGGAEAYIKANAPTAPEGYEWDYASVEFGPNDLEIHPKKLTSSDTDTTPPGPDTDTETGSDTSIIVPGPGDGTDGSDDDGGSWWWILWIIIIILLIIIIILIILLILKHRNDDDDVPPPAPPVAPAPAPMPEPTPVVVPTPEPKAPAPVIPAQPHILGATSRGIINLCDLEEYFEAGDTVSLEILKEKKLVAKSEKRLKVLGNGVINKPMTVIADYFSGAAMEKIREAGGTAIEKHTQK